MAEDYGMVSEAYVETIGIRSITAIIWDVVISIDFVS